VSPIEDTLFEPQLDRVAVAIERLRAFEPPEGYYLAYSGGKDSDVLLALAKMSGVKFDAHYNLTTVDPPELVWHIKTHPEVEVHRPKETMWQLIVRKRMPPTRLKRYCCETLKEGGGKGRRVLTGIRAEESPKRAKRQMVESCYKDTTKRYVHPIIDWSSKDIWEFIRTNKIPYCKLYDEGWKRLGCVMCPFSNQKREMVRWPKIARAYHRAILRCFISADAAGLTARARFNDGEDMWQWWISGKGKKEDGGLFT
jgi:phosphoadenosine phosphosulfate reductase